MRLLLDEMFSPAVADALRRRGIDALAVQAVPDLRALRDADVFAVAQLDGRCVVTDNVADFVMAEAAWRAERWEAHYGLVLVPSRAFPRHRPNVVGRLATALVALAAAELPGRGGTEWLRAPGE